MSESVAKSRMEGVEVVQSLSTVDANDGSAGIHQEMAQERSSHDLFFRARTAERNPVAVAPHPSDDAEDEFWGDAKSFEDTLSDRQSVSNSVSDSRTDKTSISMYVVEGQIARSQLEDRVRELERQIMRRGDALPDDIYTRPSSTAPTEPPSSATAAGESAQGSAGDDSPRQSDMSPLQRELAEKAEHIAMLETQHVLESQVVEALEKRNSELEAEIDTCLQRNAELDAALRHLSTRNVELEVELEQRPSMLPGEDGVRRRELSELRALLAQRDQRIEGLELVLGSGAAPADGPEGAQSRLDEYEQRLQDQEVGIRLIAGELVLMRRAVLGDRPAPPVEPDLPRMLELLRETRLAVQMIQHQAKHAKLSPPSSGDSRHRADHNDMYVDASAELSESLERCALLEAKVAQLEQVSAELSESLERCAELEAKVAQLEQASVDSSAELSESLERCALLQPKVAQLEQDSVDSAGEPTSSLERCALLEAKVSPARHERLDAQDVAANRPERTELSELALAIDSELDAATALATRLGSSLSLLAQRPDPPVPDTTTTTVNRSAQLAEELQQRLQVSTEELGSSFEHCAQLEARIAQLQQDARAREAAVTDAAKLRGAAEFRVGDLEAKVRELELRLVIVVWAACNSGVGCL